MLPDRVSNPGPLTYESGALPIALRGPAHIKCNNTTDVYVEEAFHAFLFYFISWFGQKSLESFYTEYNLCCINA